MFFCLFCLPKLIFKYFSVIKLYDELNIIKVSLFLHFSYFFFHSYLRKRKKVLKFFPWWIKKTETFSVSHVFASFFRFLSFLCLQHVDPLSNKSITQISISSLAKTFLQKRLWLYVPKFGHTNDKNMHVYICKWLMDPKWHSR